MHTSLLRYMAKLCTYKIARALCFWGKFRRPWLFVWPVVHPAGQAVDLCFG